MPCVICDPLSEHPLPRSAARRRKRTVTWRLMGDGGVFSPWRFSKKSMGKSGGFHRAKNNWLVVWLASCFIFPLILGMSSSQLTNSYFSEGWPNHQPDKEHTDLTRKLMGSDGWVGWYMVSIGLPDSFMSRVPFGDNSKSLSIPARPQSSYDNCHGSPL